MKKALKLQPHRHSGKIMPHRHTSFRGLAVVLLVFVASLVIIQTRVSADTIDVTGKISAPLPTEPAMITFPSDDITIYARDIAVQGTCQYIPPASIVHLYSNGTLLGTTSCGAASSFTIAVLLQTGANSLVARTSNITDDFGPDSQPVMVYVKDNPTTAPQPKPTQNTPDITKPSTAQAPKNLPLRIVSKSPYVLFSPTKLAAWNGYIEGGTAPYTFRISWGDASPTETTTVQQEEIAVTHEYKAMRNHYITVEVRDAAGTTTRATYAAITPFVPTITTTVTPPTNDLHSTITTLGVSSASIATAITVATWYHLRFVQKTSFSVAQARHKPTIRKKP